jgi:hypothetical protein
MIDVLTQSPPATAAEFLREWHRGASPGSGRADEDVPAFVPAPLREFYAGVRNRQDAIVQGRLIDPAELRLDEGLLTFYVENQAVYFWATEPSAHDPPVWGRVNASDAGWEKEGEPLSRSLCRWRSSRQ